MNSAPLSKFVLDSWPLVEWLKGKEPVRTRMAEILADAALAKSSLSISRINLGELIYIGRKEIHLSEAALNGILETFSQIPLDIASATDARVDAAVELKSRYAVSYAGAFAAALAIEHNLPLITGDREFRKLEADGLLQLHWVGA